MKRNLLSLVGSLIVAGTLVGAQDAPSQNPPDRAPQAPPASPAAQAPAASPSQDPDDTTVRGCLIQGSGPTTFILQNAKLSTDAADAKGKSYVVEISAEPDQIKSILNSHVQIVGKADKDEKESSASSDDDKKRDEKDMPKLTAKRITRVAATCPASGD